MESRPDLPPEEAVAAALDWWRLAGVDCDFADEPQEWLAEPAPVAEKASEKQPEQRDRPVAARKAVPEPKPGPVVPDKAGWPGDLDTFRAWWLAESWLDGGRTGGRVPPRGKAHAELMVVVPEPEAEDGERLLSGAQGRLLDAILAAMGIPAEAACVASALPRHTPMADWDAVAAQGLGEVLRHHIALAAPRRLLVLGNNILPLIGNDTAQRPAVSLNFNHESTNIPLLAARSLPALMSRPAWKAELWRAWLDWSAGDRRAGGPKDTTT
ncbi:hypothetical protein GCM10011371_02580 [Novosphingobium marinum]|uniref:DNA polymerase n=1 Tax=Novosphingobium marinum TaxID=1514948 RepID=A0A7Z0BSA5_9SPHN|nr:hypothetical protein [Novosphingobium marinum]NYH93949.1 DNA polymerase [Novosphingobium marinum]GGC18513.1 hypothetical protein GCM10011371_02580 [Novosphingobium marinum]